MLITPPAMISSEIVKPKPMARPTLLKSCSFQMQEQAAWGSLYRWENQDFVFEEERSADGWFLTVCLELADSTYQLHQYDSTFYTSRPTGGLKAKLQSWIKPLGKDRPHWKRRSDRWWPISHGSPLHFIGQFGIGAYACYLFSDLRADPLIAAHVDDLGTQDAEDHYDGEEKRDV